ncbi:hypothetical protein [Tenacibaculum sp. nBUS_03]|uniref:hypothetical protein n=1 Tax=Tenacibaculum sp. nBUS_03 TaxID=3395320 RepID=UPI003EBB468A
MKNLFLILFSMILTSCDFSSQKSTEESNSSIDFTGELKAKSIVENSIKKHGGDLYSNASYTFDFRGQEYSFNHDKDGYTYSLSWKDEDDTAIEIRLQNEQLLKTINNELVQLNQDDISSYREKINSVLFFVLLPFKLEDPNATTTYKGNNGLAVRFRSFYNRRNVNGIIFQDYNNYTCDPNSSLKEIAELYENDKLTYVSKIEIKNIIKY